MRNVLDIVARSKPFLKEDLKTFDQELKQKIISSKFLVIGGAGSIGQAVSKELFRRSPKKLDVVDINENNLVELVRDIRSSFGYIEGDFRTFAIDAGSIEFNEMVNQSDGYDYVLNLSALKHVRSEKDPFTLMRMIDVNILQTISTINQSIQSGAKKYFCVSSDKAANPENLMGASKRVMESFLIAEMGRIEISTARFANVAFSDGSLLHGFTKRMQKKQPISAPKDIRRFFITEEEAGQLCMLSCLLGESGDIFFPKIFEEHDAVALHEVAKRFLTAQGYDYYECQSEDEARDAAARLIQQKIWPVFFFNSTTTGEKSVEEFITEKESLAPSNFKGVGVARHREQMSSDALLSDFIAKIEKLKTDGNWTKEDIVTLFSSTVPELKHHETGQNLDNRM